MRLSNTRSDASIACSDRKLSESLSARLDVDVRGSRVKCDSQERIKLQQIVTRIEDVLCLAKLWLYMSIPYLCKLRINELEFCVIK